MKIPQSNGTTNDKHMLKRLSAIVNNRDDIFLFMET